jgi:hypothetical protein
MDVNFVLSAVREEADRRCWASGAEGITWLEDHLRIECKERERERVCFVDWNISGNSVKCFVNKKIKFGLHKMRGITSIAQRQALFQEGLLLWFYSLRINTADLFVLVVIPIRSYNNERFQNRFIRPFCPPDLLQQPTVARRWNLYSISKGS